MRHFILLFGIIFLFLGKIYAQKIDRFCIYTEGGLKVLPIVGYAQRDVGDKSELYLPGATYTIPIAPQYELKKISGVAVGMQFGIGLHIPYYRTETWSIGSKFGVQGNILLGIKPVLEGQIFFPYTLPNTSLYFRKIWKKTDIAFDLGYKKTYNFYVPYNLITGGLELHRNKNSGVRFYSSLFRERYYWRTTTGKDVPAIKIGEVGVTFYGYWGFKKRK